MACKKCGLCCIGVDINVTIEEMEKILQYLGEKDPKEYFEAVFPFIRIKKVGNRCIFLENNKCKIYQVRPKQCRDYPFVSTLLHFIFYSNEFEIHGLKVKVERDKIKVTCPGNVTWEKDLDEYIRQAIERYEQLLKYYKENIAKHLLLRRCL